jgi:CBS domain-containing protein
MKASLNDVMTANPACCTPDTPLREVARLMVEHDCGQIPVVERLPTGRPLGVVTDRDIIVRMVAQERDVSAARAADCMSSPATRVSREASLADCCALMEKKQIRRLLVVDDDDAVCGIVAQADIARSGRDQATAEMVKEISEPSH